MIGPISFGGGRSDDLNQLGGIDGNMDAMGSIGSPESMSIPQMLAWQQEASKYVTEANFLSTRTSLVKTTIGGIIDKMGR